MEGWVGKEGVPNPWMGTSREIFMRVPIGKNFEHGARVTSLPSPPFRAVPGSSEPRFANCGHQEGVHSAASRTTSISKVPPSSLRMTFGSGPRAASFRISGVSMPRRSSPVSFCAVDW